MGTTPYVRGFPSRGPSVLRPRRTRTRLAGGRDAEGKILRDGDAVVLIKDLKSKGSRITRKMGTQVQRIRLMHADCEVDCRLDGGSQMLKAACLSYA